MVFNRCLDLDPYPLIVPNFKRVYLSELVLKIITREKVRWKAENTYFSTKYMLVNNYCWPVLTNLRKRQKMWVHEIISGVKMVLWEYEGRLALSRHYRARGAQPICIHSQSCNFVNECCIAKILMKKFFYEFWLIFCLGK